MARYAAERELLAPIEDVWAFLAEPYNFADWWPGVSGVEPDRRGLAPGARWRVVAPNEPSLLRRPLASGTLLVVDVVPMRRIVFQLPAERIDAEIELEPVDERRTKAVLSVEGSWLMRGSFPRRALAQLHSLLRTGEEPGP
jgi:uncharacterized protein YndB with AHSA1/START domain